jgi:hypothetical protein
MTPSTLHSLVDRLLINPEPANVAAVPPTVAFVNVIVTVSATAVMSGNA